MSEQELKKEALERMINKIYKLERDNAKTCIYSDNKMRDKKTAFISIKMLSFITGFSLNIYLFFAILFV